MDGWINAPMYPLSQCGAFMPTLSIFAGSPLGVDRLMNLAHSPAGLLGIQCRKGSKTQEQLLWKKGGTRPTISSGQQLLWGTNTVLQGWGQVLRQNSWFRDFSDGPVAKTPCSQCRGPGLYPWSGNQILQLKIQCCNRDGRFCMPQLRPGTAKLVDK